MTTTITCRLDPGDTFDDLAGPDGHGWCLTAGALRLDPVDEPGRPALLALPGDLLGLEASLKGRCPYRVRALVPSSLQGLTAADDPEQACSRVRLLLEQQWRRAVQMTGLRTGGVPDRVRHLLLLLSACGGADGDVLLPRLRDLADTIDSTPESVSRVITNLRRLQLFTGASYERPHHPDAALAAAALPAGMTCSRAGAQLVSVRSQHPRPGRPA